MKISVKTTNGPIFEDINLVILPNNRPETHINILMSKIRQCAAIEEATIENSNITATLSVFGKLIIEHLDALKEPHDNSFRYLISCVDNIPIFVEKCKEKLGETIMLQLTFAL